MMISIIEESDKANQYYWILEYIDLARIDPVHVVQNRTKTGKYHKKKGSRYDSNESSEGSVFDLLSPQQSDLSQPTSPDQNDGWKVVGKPARSSHHSPARTDRDYHRSFSKNANSSTSINSHSSLRRVNSYKENGNHHKYYSGNGFSPSKHHSHQRTTSYHSQGNSHVSEERSESSSSGKLYSISRELRRWSNDDDEEGR